MESNFIAINQTVLFEFVNLPEEEINHKFIVTRLIEQDHDLKKDYNHSVYPFISNFKKYFYPNEKVKPITNLKILLSKDQAPKISKNKKLESITNEIFEIASNSSIPSEVLKSIKEKSQNNKIYYFAVDKLSSNSQDFLSFNKYNHLLIVDLKRIHQCLITYFIECNTAYKIADRKKIEFKKINFHIADSQTIYSDFIDIIKMLDDLNIRDNSIQDRLKVCECTLLNFRDTFCKRPYFWTPKTDKNISDKCQNRIENKKEKIKNKESN